MAEHHVHRRGIGLQRGVRSSGGQKRASSRGTWTGSHGLPRRVVCSKVAQTLARHSTITLTLDRYAIFLQPSASSCIGLHKWSGRGRRGPGGASH